MTTHVSLLGLGIIPAWQFSMDPAVNYKINPNVVYPDGVYQTTTQPLYPYYQGPEGMSGLGSVVSAVQRAAYGAAWQQAAADARRKGVPMYDSPGYNGISAAGPRMVLRGPNMIIGRQQLGLGTRLGLGLTLGLGAVTLLGKLFGR